MADDPTGGAPAQNPRQPPPQVEARWCLVGNVVAERLHGEDGELRRGTKLFPGGTKVYYRSAYWGMGAECVTVLGLSRRPRRWITATVRRCHLENWRAQLVYAPRVLQELRDGADEHGDDVHGDEGEARALAGVMTRGGPDRRLVPRTPAECRRVAADAGAALRPGPAPGGEGDGEALVLHRGTVPVAGLVYRAARPTPGARAAASFAWRDLWVRPAPPAGNDTGDPLDPSDGTAAVLLTALRSRFPWHDLSTLHAELAPPHA